MTHVFARKALLQKGWAENVRLSIDGGRIDDVQQGVTAEPADSELGVDVQDRLNDLVF